MSIAIRPSNLLASLALAPFSFITNHGLALLTIAEDPQIRMRDIASSVEITERAAQRIVSDLIEAGYIDRTRRGRRNEYTVRTDLSVALPKKRDVDLGALLDVLLPSGTSVARRAKVAGPR
jgi:DNA-binding MarR family transcriptional regulator